MDGLWGKFQVKARELRFVVLLVLEICLVSPACATWSVQQSEPDPFDPSKSTFIATTIGASGGVLAVRCLDGAISLLVVSGPSNASSGEAVDLKLIADAKVIQEENAEVISTTDLTTSVQFGDAFTLEYLDGAQKISLRYQLGDAISTVSFSGGKSLTVVIGKALKACGLEASEAPKASHQGGPSKVPTAGEETSMSVFRDSIRAYEEKWRLET